eukprot:XP_003731553.1 PREDICTED: uncharacterized protein LOC764380 [Strongylocentrotus purpuratus]
MALVDSKYQFLWIDVGGVGHQSDAQIYNNSELKECIEAGTLGIRDPAPLPHDDEEHPMPYFFVGDDAFAMRTYVMKPYCRRNMDQQQKIFNYRLSGARRVVENAFGIPALRFQCFLGQMKQEPDTVRLLIELPSCCTTSSGSTIRHWTSACSTRRMPSTTSSLELGELPPSL